MRTLVEGISNGVGLCRYGQSACWGARGAVLLVNPLGETGNNSADSLLVGEQKCCLVQVVAGRSE